MSTEKLELYQPNILTDEWEHFLNGLSENFKKLDDAHWERENSPPLSGDYNIGRVKLNANPIIGGYAGWINIRTGKAAAKWVSLKQYVSGDVVVPDRDNGHFYTCTQAGTSGITEPIFPVSSDGTVRDTRGGNTWISNHMYTMNSIVFPTVDNGRFYVCIQAGESGATEPIWQLLDGTTTYDKNTAWRSYRIATWRESGPAALFRPFGKID